MKMLIRLSHLKEQAFQVKVELTKILALQAVQTNTILTDLYNILGLGLILSRVGKKQET